MLKLSKGNRIAVGVLLGLILIFLLFPLYWMVVTSFKTNMEAYQYPPTFIAQYFNLDSYRRLFTENNEFFIYYRNNFIVAGFVAAIITVIAIISGYGLSRFKIKWNKWVIAALMMSQMFPVISRMISLYDILGKINLINTHAGLILALTAAQVPFCTILMASFYDNIPKDVEESAHIDGCSRIGIMTKVCIPLIKPGMLAVGIYSFLMTWDDYLHAVTLIQHDELRTLSAGIALRYLGELSYDWSLINAISVIGTIPMVLLFFFFQKYMVKGLVAGAVKG